MNRMWDVGFWGAIIALLSTLITATGFLWKLVGSVSRVAEELTDLKGEVKEANKEFRAILSDHGQRIARLEGRSDAD